MFFFIFFGLLMLTIITIGLYPTLNKKIKKGNIKKELKLLIIWLIISGFGVFIIFRMRIIYTPLNVYEEFWQSTMVFFDNIILGILIIFSAGFVSINYELLGRNVKKAFFYLSSLLLVFLCLQSIIHFLVRYYIISSEIDKFILIFWILLLVFNEYLHYIAVRLVDYNLKDIILSLYK